MIDFRISFPFYLYFVIYFVLNESTKFNEMWQKMVTQYDQGKKFIMDLIEQSVSAYDQREELGNKIQNLNDKQCVETNNHTQEIRELQRKLDHDAKLQDFFAIKGNRRVNAELESRENERRLKQQELADEHLKNLQTIMNQIQVKNQTKFNGIELFSFCTFSKMLNSQKVHCYRFCFVSFIDTE